MHCHTRSCDIRPHRWSEGSVWLADRSVDYLLIFCLFHGYRIVGSRYSVRRFTQSRVAPADDGTVVSNVSLVARWQADRSYGSTEGYRAVQLKECDVVGFTFFGIEQGMSDDSKHSSLDGSSSGRQTMRSEHHSQVFTETELDNFRFLWTFGRILVGLLSLTFFVLGDSVLPSGHSFYRWEWHHIWTHRRLSVVPCRWQSIKKTFFMNRLFPFQSRTSFCF